MKTQDLANNNEVLSNHILSFTLAEAQARGRLVRLEKQIHHVLHGHRYPQLVSQLLGELITNACLLGSLLKFEGILTIQIMGNKALRFLTADYTSEGHIRGYASILDAEALRQLPVDKPDLKALFGQGHMVITIENRGQKPYQAVIPLEGVTLTECIMHYFSQSEQLDSFIHVVVQKKSEGWRVAGLLLQKLAVEGGNKLSLKQLKQRDKHWKLAISQLQQIPDKTLLRANFIPDTFMFKTFVSATIQLFTGSSISAKCRCSEERMKNALLMLSKEERKSLKIKGKYEVKCQFCNKTRYFTDPQL